MSRRVVLVDSGGNNLVSVQAALERLGIEAPISADAATIRRATHVLLPGVGAAAAAMQRLVGHGLHRLLPELRQPVLGICVGMQLLFESSAEGETACLGLLPGRVERLPTASGIRIPHMGWNRLEVAADSALTAGLDGAYAYFVHSYAAPPSPFGTLTAVHGVRFAAAVERDNYYGVQFHPERSGAAGRRLLENFFAL